MPPSPKGVWFPRLVGLGALLLALRYVAWCVLVPPAAGDELLFGYRLLGVPGWIASAAHALFFVWLAYACLRRKRVAVWAVIGYCVYLIENVWIFSIGGGRDLFGKTSSMVILLVLFSAMLLAFCRVVLDRRADFDR